jgi:hypothetical protein
MKNARESGAKQTLFSFRRSEPRNTPKKAIKKRLYSFPKRVQPLLLSMQTHTEPDKKTRCTPSVPRGGEYFRLQAIRVLPAGLGPQKKLCQTATMYERRGRRRTS